MAITLCEYLEKCLNRIENEFKTDRLAIYNNELLIMTNNSIVVKHGGPVSGFVTMTILGYTKFTAPQMSQKQYQYFQHQMDQSMSMIQTSVKERQKFFQKMRQKINALRLSVERFELLDF